LKVLVQRLDGQDKPLKYEHDGDSGIDLYATETVTLHPFERKIVGTGIKIAMEKGLEAQTRPKSGLALNHGITLLNTPGTIDSNYRGEIKIILINLSDKQYTVEKGKKIAQLVFQKVEFPELREVKELDSTTRGEGGFGSTGLG